MDVSLVSCSHPGEELIKLCLAYHTVMLFMAVSWVASACFDIYTMQSTSKWSHYVRN